MEITAKMVAELREMTGAGMMDCKKALVEASGEMEKAKALDHPDLCGTLCGSGSLPADRSGNIQAAGIAAGSRRDNQNCTEQ